MPRMEITIPQSDQGLKLVLDKLVREINDEAGADIISRSELVRTLLYENIPDAVDELPQYVEEYIEVKKREQEERIHAAIARDKKRNATFLDFVGWQVFQLLERDATEDEILEYIDAQERIFEIRGHGDDFEEFKANYKEYARQAHKRRTAQVGE